MSKSSARPRYHSVRSIRSGNGPPLTGKDILVFCDGTGKDGRIKSSGKEPPTNIWRLYKLAVESETAISGGRQKEIVYLSGIGSGSFKNPRNILSQIFGTTIVENIVAAYLHVAKHYEARDGIHLFGYSRGAFVARKVASLIYRIGIVRTEAELLKLWSQHERPIPWHTLNSLPRGAAIPIESLVVWDTVGAIQTLPTQKKMELDILGMPDEELPPNVRHAFHAVAFHENRKLFRVTLFKPTSPEDRERLQEVWFPGAHSDVGGGSEKLDLPNISLDWVLGELRERCSLTVPHVQVDYSKLDKFVPTDAYHETPPWKRMVDKCETRISLLKPTTFVHETVLYLHDLISASRNARSNPAPHMLTAKDLMKLGWDIKTYVVARKTFETLKRASVNVQKFGEHYRSRIASLHVSGTPRSSINTTQQLQNTSESTPRSRRSSVATQIRPESATPPPLTSHLHPARIRTRAESQITPDPLSTRPEQVTPRPTPTLTPQNRRNEPNLGTTPSHPPSAFPHPAATARPASIRSRAESYAAPPTRPTSSGHPGQMAADWVFIEPPRRTAVSATNPAPSRSGPSIPPQLPAHVSPANTRSRVQSHAGPRLPTIPSKKAIDNWTIVEMPQHSKSTMSPMDVPTRSDVFEPRSPTTLVRTASIRSRAESHVSRRLRSPSPVEAVSIPGTGSRLYTIPSGQAVHHSTPAEMSQHGRNAVSPAGVTSHSDFVEPRSPTTHVRTTSTRSRTESYTARRPRGTSPVEVTPTPPLKSTPAVARHGRNDPFSASGPPSRGITTRNPNLPKVVEENNRTSEKHAQSQKKDSQRRKA